MKPIDDAIYQTQTLNVANSYYLLVSRCVKLVIIYGTYFATAAANQKLFAIGSIFYPEQRKDNALLGKDNDNNVFGITVNSNGDCSNTSAYSRSNFIIYGAYTI